MRKLDESGSLLVPLVVVIVLFVAAAGFGVWAFMGRQDYKTNSDKKSAAAVQKAIVATGKAKDAEFVEKEKSPVKSYTGPAAYGTVSFEYPKTWSAYIVETPQSGTDVRGHLHPNFVPDIASKDILFALKFTIVERKYTDVLKTFQSAIQKGTVKSTAYAVPKLPEVVGVKLEGNVDRNISATRTGTMVILPIRDKTIQIWTEGDSHLDDFNKIILPSLTFVP